MKAKVILKQFATELNRHPFRPFTLIVADGATITIDAPEHACIDRRGRIITFNAANGARHIIDTQHVTWIAAD